MWQLLISIIGILITIFFVVGTHEAAHFMMARLLGIKVLRFSIGFGKRLWHTFDKKGTEYVIALIPLGGYVKMLDENEGEVPAKELASAFNRQPFYKKFLVVAAGPVINILCAFIIYWLIFIIGITTIRPIIGNITPHSIADEAGLKLKQEIVSIDNHRTSSWTSVIFRLVMHAGNRDRLDIKVENPASQPLKDAIYSLDLSDWHLDTLNPDPLGSIGITPFIPTIPLVIGTIAKDSPAASSKLKIGDELVALNGKSLKNWETFIQTITHLPEQKVEITIKRQGKLLTFPIEIGYQRTFSWNKTGYLGVAPYFKWPEKLLRKIKYGPVAAIGPAWQEVTTFSYLNLLLLGKLITGKLSLQSLGGPITIFQSAGMALNSGFISFLGFLAFLSISIGIINLIPIPGLDGGHLLIQIIEFIIRRPVSERVLSLLYRLGFIFLLLILVQAMMNDILRLF